MISHSYEVYYWGWLHLTNLFGSSYNLYEFEENSKLNQNKYKY